MSKKKLLNRWINLILFINLQITFIRATITIDLKTEGDCIAYLNYNKTISNLNVKIYVNKQEVTVNKNLDSILSSMKAISYQSKTGETQIVINTNLESIDYLFYSSSNQCCRPNHIKSIAIKSSSPITTSLKYAFSGTQFESIDLTNFDLSKVTSFNGMFNGNDKLVSVKFGDSITSSANTMEGMFYNCKNLVSLDLSNFDTSKVTTMKELFRDCNKLTYLNIKNFKVSNVENFSAMFCLCNSLTSLDLSNFITTKAKDMGQMFEHCDSLQYINISNFDTSKVLI